MILWFAGNLNKEAQECRASSSQVKRRRMLQFNTQPVESSFCSEETSSSFLKSNVCAYYLSPL